MRWRCVAFETLEMYNYITVMQREAMRDTCMVFVATIQFCCCSPNTLR